MANKKEKKDTVKNTSRTKKIPMLKLDNNDKIAAKIVYTKDNSKCFRINDIDVNKIRISEKSLYSKQHNAYKYYVLYEHNNEYMPLRITLKDLVRYYDVYNDHKRMNFKINDVLSDKIYQSLENIFEQIENYFKIKVTDETCFKENIKSTSIIKEGQVITKESDANFIRK